MNEKPKTEAEWLEYLHLATYDKEKAAQHVEAITSTIDRQQEALNASKSGLREANEKIAEAVAALKALWR